MIEDKQAVPNAEAPRCLSPGLDRRARDLSLASTASGPEMMDIDALPDTLTEDTPTSLGPCVPYPEGRHIWLARTNN